MQATTERTERQEASGIPNLSEFILALEALRKRQAKHDKADALLKNAIAQIDVLQGKAEEAAKRRAAALISAWSRGKSELTDAERRRLDDEERSIMAGTYDFDITADQLPALKAHLQQEAAEQGEAWRELRKIGRHLTLEEIEKGIVHDIAALSDPRTQLFEIEQFLTNIRDKCAAGEYFRNNEAGPIHLGPEWAKYGDHGEKAWIERVGDPESLKRKYGVEALLERYRVVAKVSDEVDHERAQGIAHYYVEMGVPIYTYEERELERKSYIGPALRHRIRTYPNSASDAHGVIHTTIQDRIDEIDQAEAALRALQAKPF